jgi:hypothetical protein
MLNNKIIYALVAIILILLLAYALFFYIPKQKEEIRLQEYKKSLFESSLCQYKCPLTIQKIGNKTQELPDVICTQDCALTFRNQTSLGNSYTNEELQNDNLFADFEAEVISCGKQSLINSTSINNSFYFSCISERLENLRSNYSYLN